MIKSRGSFLEPYLYVLPYFIVFALFLVIPGVSGMVIGLFDWPVVGLHRFLGLGNYRELFHDGVFLRAVLNTLVYTVMYVPVFIVVGLLLALLLNRQFLGKSLLRMAIYAPYIFMIPAVGVIWRWLMDSNFGVLNYYLQIAHLPTVPWLTSERAVLPSIVLVITWETVGYSMVIFLAGLQEIPQECQGSRGTGWRLGMGEVLEHHGAVPQTHHVLPPRDRPDRRSQDLRAALHAHSRRTDQLVNNHRHDPVLQRISVLPHGLCRGNLHNLVPRHSSHYAPSIPIHSTEGYLND